MPKKFNVQLGRLVRETLTVTVEVPDDQDEAWLLTQLSAIYDEAEGDDFDDYWEKDTEWGCEESDSHAVIGPADENAEVDFAQTVDGNTTNRHEGITCAACNELITEEADGESTPHGSMHKGCAEEHEREHPDEW